MKKKFFMVFVFSLTLAVNGWTQAQTRTLLKNYNTHGSSLTYEDIMRIFVNEVRNYLQQYDRYGCYYFVEIMFPQGDNYNRNNYNHEWNTQVFEEKYQWGTMYFIRLEISIGIIVVSFCNNSYIMGEQSAHEIVTTRAGTVGGNNIRNYIVNTAISMFNESEIKLKMNKDKYSEKAKSAFFSEIKRILL